MTNQLKYGIIKKKERKKDMSKEKSKETCVICGKEFEGWGNNPYPVKEEGRCCDECNETKVIPARIMAMMKKGRN